MRAFSTLEIVLALAILVATLASAVLVVMGLPNAIENGIRRVEAASLASQTLEAAENQGLQDFASLGTSSSTADGYHISIQVDDLDDYTKRLTDTVTWTDVSERTQRLVENGFAVDPGHAPVCSKIVSGDWHNPFSRTFPIAPPFTHLTAASFSTMTVSRQLLIAGAASTTAATDPDLFLFSIASTTAPMYVSSIDTASTTKLGLASVVSDGTYIYAASSATPNFSTCAPGPSCAQLVVVDIRTPASPNLVANLALATASPPYASGSGGQSSGRSIAYANGFVYLGLAKGGTAQTDEFSVIDVHDPLHPTWIGGFPIGRSITSIRVRNTLAYLTTDDPARELVILNVHDAAHITQAGAVDAPGNQLYGYARSSDYLGQIVSVARTYSPDGPELVLASFASSTTTELGSADLSSPVHHTSAEDLLVRDSLTLVLTDSSLQFWNSADPSRLVSYRSDILLPSSSAGLALACAGNTVYASSAGSFGSFLSVFTGL